MADFLTAVKSVRNQKEDRDHSSDITEVKSSPKSTEDASSSITLPIAADKNTSGGKAESKKSLSSPEDILQTLRSQPDLDVLISALKALHSHRFGPEFSIHAPGPLQSQIINALITNVIPDFWPSLKDHDTKDLIRCLSNVAGFNAIIARLRFLSSGDGSKQASRDQSSQVTEDLLSVTEQLFKGDHVVGFVFANMQTAVPEKAKRDMIWKDFVNLIGSGKVVSTIAQANDRSESNERHGERSKAATWLASGPDYSTWLGRNISCLILKDLKASSDGSVDAAAGLLAKSLRLGYSNNILGGFLGQVVLGLASGNAKEDALQLMLKTLPMSSTRIFVEHVLRWCSTMSTEDGHRALLDFVNRSKETAAIAALISLVVRTSRPFQDNLLALLSDAPFSSTLSFSARRACLAAISFLDTASDDFQALLEKLMSNFNDTVFANHAPVLQQESSAQTLLLVAGYVHRQAPMALLMTARSSNHMQGVSNRLDSSNVKARWLGMVVATVISSLVDKEGSKMSFGTDDMQTQEAEWYSQLVNVEDIVGTIKEFDELLRTQGKLRKPKKRSTKPEKVEEMPQLNGKPIFGPPRPPAPTEVIGEKVTEVLDSDGESDEDDLKPYAKPDSDPEDSDEDATLVNRKKARPPVYIRDLMAMLRDDKDADRFQLGMKHAAGLIRRKSTFGAEVKDHAEEIGVILCNLQDPFSTEDFNELKLQAMIAVLLSDVKTMASGFSRQAFLGDYSIAQRCAILSTIGLGGRELAGLKQEDDLNPAQRNTDFPSKRLPSRLHSIYNANASSTKRLEAASSDMEQALIKPMALQAADQSTAHLNAVKVRTFSSRMEVERTRRKPAPNALAKIFGEAFFFPLVNRYQQEIAAYSNASVYSSVPFLLITFLKTLALLLNASGPSTAGLPDISSEHWDLLLSLRVKALSDISILQALLFSLLTLLEVNTDKKRIAQEHPKQLMETQQWVDMVFERTGAGSAKSENSDEAKVQTLAAGVLVKTREVIEAYQKELIGFSIE